MQLLFALLADRATIRPDKRLDITGTMFGLVFDSFPQPLPPVHLAVGFLPEMPDRGTSKRFEVAFVEPDGPETRSEGPPIEIPPDHPLDIAAYRVANFRGTQIFVPGNHAFRVYLDGAEIAKVPLMVFRRGQEP